MRLPTFADPGDGRLARTVAVTFLSGAAMVALYFGRDVLIPAAVAVLLAFVLNPVVSWLRSALPLSVSVTLAVGGAMTGLGILAVLVMTQLAEVAGSLATYQTNLHQKIMDVRQLAEGGGPLSRFLAMTASLARDPSSDPGPSQPTVRVQSGDSSLSTVVTFVAPLVHPLLSIGIVIILVVFILLDRDHLNDKFVRLLGADVHATSDAVGDAAARIARMLSLQLLTNLGFAVLVGGSLFIVGMPNALLWGLLAGGLRFVPYVGAALGALLPTLVAIAVMPGWLMPLLVLGIIITFDILIGHLVEPLLFGESTGLTPLALILAAIFWGTLWGPVGLLLSAPLTICLLVLGTHVQHLQFLQVLLGAEPALAPYQQVYRRLIRKAVIDACAVALKEIDEKGDERGLDDALGRMLVLAEGDCALGRLTADQTTAIVDGTDHVLDFLESETNVSDENRAASVEASAVASADTTEFRCIGGRGEIDDAAAALIAFALRQRGFAAKESARSKVAAAADGSPAIHLVCYASHPSEAVVRYNVRKLGAGGRRARHAVIEYEVAPTPALPATVVGPGTAQKFVGGLPTICRLAAEHATELMQALPREA
jgi:predicted PurR-regulated permease PerM